MAGRPEAEESLMTMLSGGEGLSSLPEEGGGRVKSSAMGMGVSLSPGLGGVYG